MDSFASSSNLPSPSKDAQGSKAAGHLNSGVLGTADIIFMVVAAAAPMAVVVALMPMAFGYGNGSGVPAVWLGAIIAMLMFAAGYVKIIPHVRNAGAFYAYIAASIGKPWGLGAAYVAALCYFALACSTVGAFAYFAEQLFGSLTGITWHWSVWAFACIALVGTLSYRRITLAATVLGVALLAETAIILLLDIKIVYDVGLSSLDVPTFSADRIVTPGLGIAAIYAFNSMIGIEGTAIYQEEARDPKTTVPRATYLALIATGVFYLFTAWCLSSSSGPDQVSEIARQDPGMFVANRSRVHLGESGVWAVQILVLTSAFAAALGLFNNSARYLFALARDGVFPQWFARTHDRHGSPHIAAVTLICAMCALFVAAVALQLDPLVNVATALTGLGSVGLMALLSLTSLAIPIFFARRREFGIAASIAPALGGIVILTATFLALVNYPALTGVNSTVINHLPYLLLALFFAGMAQAGWLRATHREYYERIGASRVDG